jgi:hypothetical protein
MRRRLFAIIAEAYRPLDKSFNVVQTVCGLDHQRAAWKEHKAVCFKAES